MTKTSFISNLYGSDQHPARVDDFAKTQFFVENMQNALVLGGEKECLKRAALESRAKSVSKRSQNATLCVVYVQSRSDYGHHKKSFSVEIA